MALNKKTRGNYLYVIQGTVRQEVPESTQGAVKRVFKRTDGTEGVKYERVWDSLSGRIVDISFYDSEYGKQMYVTVKDGDYYKLQLNAGNSYCEDLMTKLPNVNFEKDVELIPYDFEDKNKRRQGITVMQDGEKLQDFFKEIITDENGKFKEAKNINGMIEPEGDTDTYAKEDWKIYYLQRSKFLINYIIEKVAPEVPKMEQEQKEESGVDKIPEPIEYPEDDIDPEDIPF